MEISEQGLIFYSLAISLFITLFLIEIMDQVLSRKVPHLIEKTTIQEKLLILIVGLLTVEMAYQFEVEAFTWYNSVASWQVSGLAKYTRGFVIIGSVIEETIKFGASAILVWKLGYKKLYTTLGVGAFFAGFEHFYQVAYTRDQELINAIIDLRWRAGAQWIHIGNAMLLLLVLTIANSERKLNQYKFKVPLYITTFGLAIYIHAVYNYVSIMAGFDEFDEVLSDFISWFYFFLLALLWTLLLVRFRETKPIENTSEKSK